MKKKLLHLAVLVLFAAITFLACKKNIDDDQPAIPDFPVPPGAPVHGSVSGIVFNESNSAMAGATISCGGVNVQTDATGHFEISNVTLDKYMSVVTVDQPGYFKSYRSFCAQPTMNYVEIKLIQKILSGTFNSDVSENITLTNGTDISFQANSIVMKSTGAAYTGQVKVFAAYIDPTSSEISATIPGSLMGKDATNLYELQSTGMIAVDLETPSGEALQLGSGKTATIQLPIPASLQSKAPSAIDTWSLDNNGIWIKEGSANRSGNYYEMEVTHFSFWNCDFPAGAIYLTVHLQDQNGNPLPNTLVRIVNPSVSSGWGVASYGRTDSLGNASGMVPSNQVLELNIVPGYQCNAPLYSQTIGPFTANSTITVTATLAPQQTLTVTGSANACNNVPIVNGTAVISAGNYNYYATITNGVYSTTFSVCNPTSSINVRIRDISGQYVNYYSGPVPVSGNSVTVPVITACSPVGDYSPNCAQASVNGSYTVGVPLNSTPGSNNNIILPVTVNSPGTYAITTDTVNGISFAGSGVFTAAGSQTVVLHGSGAPLASGTFTLHTLNAGSNCTFTVNVGTASGNAVFTLNCSMANLYGSYVAGTSMANNYVTMPVSVSASGQVSLTSNTSNGVTFSLNGFISTGVNQVQLIASGTPLNQGVFTYTVSSGCSFTVTYLPPNTNPAVFTLTGTGGSCGNTILYGRILAGLPMHNSNYVLMQANVTTPGSYHITTGSPVNGLVFSDSGTFTQAGPHDMWFSAEGTPQAAGAYTYLPQWSGGASTCPILVTVSDSALYEFSTAGNCSAIVNGTYQYGVNTTANEYVTVSINVIRPGPYNIITYYNNLNFGFSGSGYFSNTGVQTVVLQAMGVPNTTGTYPFYLAPTINFGCSFNVTVQ